MLESGSQEVKESWNQEVTKSQIVLWIANVIRVRVRVSAEISQEKHQAFGALKLTQQSLRKT